MKVLRARVYDQIQQEAQSEYDANRKSGGRRRSFRNESERITSHKIE